MTFFIQNCVGVHNEDGMWVFEEVQGPCRDAIKIQKRGILVA